MWFFLVGKLFCVIVVYFLSKTLLSFYESGSDLFFFEKVISWFLLDHLYNYYEESINNCYSCKLEFRSLLYTIIALFFKIFIYVYWLVILEYSFLVLVVTIPFCFLLYFGIIDLNKKIKIISLVKESLVYSIVKVIFYFFFFIILLLLFEYIFSFSLIKNNLLLELFTFLFIVYFWCYSNIVVFIFF